MTNWTYIFIDVKSAFRIERHVFELIVLNPSIFWVNA